MPSRSRLQTDGLGPAWRAPEEVGVSEVSGMTFEDAFAALAQIVEQLDSGDLTLEQTVGLYERGQSLAQHCQQLLDEAELRVAQLAENGSEQ